jgi:hypothetical protein
VRQSGTAFAEVDSAVTEAERPLGTDAQRPLDTEAEDPLDTRAERPLDTGAPISAQIGED